MSDNEKPLLRLYDDETGEETVRSRQSVEAVQEEQILSLMHDLESMTVTRGWRHVENHIYDTIEAFKEKLVDEQDVTLIRKYQSTIAAYSNLLGFVVTRIGEGRLLQEQKTQERELDDSSTSTTP